ncbi:MAG: hypothetical protein CVU62_08640 [Deltaproteobacteria bacterium HGW-Deltaproteobacteria-2]|jgi:hypothetical protein|nr:MAG: hypothetical protein CVU62_08640 [Deltaproteobacteria bacterium HGW-Deltaproteobacteria-2]
MKRTSFVWSLFLILALTLLAGCSSSSGSNPALSADNINLIFVVSPDLAYQTPGDVNSDTANLSNQGLHRSLLMATYLKTHLLGTNNVTGIYTLAPMTHLQTANNYPDMAAIGFIQQFALLNQVTVQGTTANSYPINTAYALGDVPGGVIEPSPYIPDAQGLAFNDASNNNITLVTRIINANQPGFYVFSAPWETISALLTNIKTTRGYNLNLPDTYMGTNFVYVISITPQGFASLAAFDSKLNPPATYPVLPPPPIVSASCTQQDYFSYTLIDGVNGVKVPTGANTNQTVYLIRHAEAHPTDSFEDGNFVGAGQWRALSLPNFLPYALRGQPSPTVVYSIDPAQSFTLAADFSVSYVRPSLTVLPYAIANNLPYYLVAGFYIGEATDPGVAEATSNFLFTNLAGVNLSNQTVLLAWEHEHYPPLITYLLQSYGVTVPPTAFPWPQTDYDTIWTVKLDAQGNLTVNNALCEGIDSASLPKTAPKF